MDNLETLSDDELRLKLLQYGFPNLPITQTTRKTLIKKLRNFVDTENKKLRKTSSNVARYSSAEDDSDNNEIGATATSARLRNKRITVSGIPTSTSSLTRNTFKTPSMEMPPPRSRTSPRTSSMSPSTKSTAKKSSIYVSPVIINDSEEDDIDLTSFSNSSLNYSSSSLKNGGSNGTADENDNDNEDEEDAGSGNSTSDYTRRLLQFRGSTNSNINNDPKSIYTRKRLTRTEFVGAPPMNENDIVYHAEPSPEPVQIPLNIAIRNFINRLDEYYGFKQTFIPYVLLAILVIFFLIIFGIYVTISPDIQNTISPLTTNYKVCEFHHENDASYTCIEESQLNSSLNLLKRIGQQLQQRVLAKSCQKLATISSLLCVKDIVKQQSDDLLHLLKDVHNCEYLIDQNQQWGIQNTDPEGNVIALEQVIAMRPHQENCFTITKPNLPLKCKIFNKMQTVFVVFGCVCIVLILLYAGNKFWKFVVEVKEKRREQVKRMINEIINALLEKAMLDKDNPVVIIGHLRDKLIEPAKRKEYEWAWIEAIKYLEQNDSRIQFEIKNINGEDFKVIRWIDEPKSPMPQNSPPQIPGMYNGGTNNRIMKKSLWMGPAFDKSNKIKDPPTQCLKIRQMFDKYETNDPNLHEVIQNSILNKLRDKNCRIYDIQLDLKTCCVYMKCASNMDAGIVHDNINGWWFDNRLVSIKFLRLERYLQRFPISASLTTCLRPSPASVAALSGTNSYEYLNSNGYDENDIDYDDDEDN